MTELHQRAQQGMNGLEPGNGCPYNHICNWLPNHTDALLWMNCSHALHVYASSALPHSGSIDTDVVQLRENTDWIQIHIIKLKNY